MPDTDIIDLHPPRALERVLCDVESRLPEPAAIDGQLRQRVRLTLVGPPVAHSVIVRL